MKQSLRRVAIYHDQIFGGVRRAAMELSNALHHAGVHTDTYSRHFSTDESLSEQERFFESMRLRASVLARKVDDKKYDAVLVHPSPWGAPAILRYLKTPSIYYCPEPQRSLYDLKNFSIPRLARLPDRKSVREKPGALSSRWKFYWRNVRLQDRQAVQSASVILTNSRRSQRAIKAAYGRSAQVCFLGVVPQRFRPSRSVRKQRAVLSVGIFAAHKGFDLLVRALALIPEDERPVLWLAGPVASLDYKHYVQKLARFVGVSVKIHGRLTDSHLIDLYRRASVFAFAPIREPFGLVVLEAMSCELPVVVVDEAGASEAIQHNTTGLITPRTAHALSQAIQHLLSHPKEAKAMATKARQEILRSWTWDHAAERLLRIWEEHRP